MRDAGVDPGFSEGGGEGGGGAISAWSDPVTLLKFVL